MITDIKFGTDGWREVIADKFTFDNVRVVSNAIAMYLTDAYKNEVNKYPVLIGFDPRFLADRFALTCAKELNKYGLKTVLSESIVPTPVMAFHAAMGESKTLGAIQFTASHNPPKYCGMKFIMNYGGPAPEEITNKIMENIEIVEASRRDASTGAIQTFNPKPLYFSHVKKLIDFNVIKNAKLKVVYDSLYGAGRSYLDYLLKDAGCEVVTLHDKIDPLFGGMLPEPKEEFLGELKDIVLKEKAMCGLATDGDADRLGAMDENGVFYSPNKIGLMLLRHLVKNKKQKGAVVRTLTATHLLDCLAAKYDLKCVETKVGYKWIAKVMLEEDVLIGIEESGGISIKGHVPDKDAVLSGMLLVEMLAYEKKTLKEIYSETLAECGRDCVNDRFDLHVTDKEKKDLLDFFINYKESTFAGYKIISKNTLEGVKFIFEDGSWMMVRASGTEPMARIYFEATSKEVLDNLKKTISNTNVVAV